MVTTYALDLATRSEARDCGADSSQLLFLLLCYEETEEPKVSSHVEKES